MPLTRRVLLGATAATAALAQSAKFKSWKPRFGILGRLTEGNLEFARQEGYRDIEIFVQPNTNLDVGMSDAQIEKTKALLESKGLPLAVIGSVENHVAPDAAARERTNAHFAKVIELAGRFGTPFVSTASGNIPGAPLAEQVKEIVRVYRERYLPLCEKHNVRILWENWAGGPNIAISPVGYEALFKAFGNSAPVGLQFDPSHLVAQMIDPVQCARDFSGHIYAVHLKDTEILWPVLRRVGINPLDRTPWWRFRLPGMGAVDWPAFFTVLMEKGYDGPMNIEHEDRFYGFPFQAQEFPEEYKQGFRVANRYLRQFLPV